MPRLKIHPSRTTVAALLAAVLLVAGGSLVVSPATAAPTAESAAANAHRAQAKAALAKVVTAFSDKRTARSAPRTSPLPRTDVTMLLRDLRKSLPSLTRTERATASRYLAAPPMLGSGCGGFLSGPFVMTEHFCIHYVKSGVNATTQTQAELTAATFEYVYTQEVTNRGYRAPLDDGDGLVDVTLEQLGNQGIYGYCDSNFSGSTVPAYCAVDNDFSRSEFGASSVPVNSLRVTAAHEFFHAIQFAYDADDDSWFLEGTAVWMEDIVYPSINDYLQYLPVSQLRRPMQSTDYASGLAVYGTVVFWKYLSERFRDVNIIRSIWEAAAGPRNGIQAVAAVLQARGYSFGTEFARYGVWNTFAPDTYADRRFWPAPAVLATRTLSKARRQAAYQVKLNHLAHGPLVFRPQAKVPTRAKLRVVVDAPDKSHGSQATVQVRYRSGKVATYFMPLSGTGYGSKLYTFNRKYVRSVIVIVSNASTGYYNDQTFRVRAKLVY